MRLFLSFMAISLLAQNVAAQDERYIRELFSGDIYNPRLQEEAQRVHHFLAQGPMYEFDLNGDHRNESFVVEKRDGEDWLHIHDYSNTRIFSHRFRAQAAKSRIYRLRIHRLSPETQVVVIHFFEGVNDYLHLNANARFYFLTIENNDLKTLSVYRGPAYWEEFDDKKDHMRRRKYELEFIDLNNDGTKEIIVRFQGISSAYAFRGQGKWSEL